MPSLLTLRAKKVKQNALKRLQKARKLSSLLDVEKKKPGRKKQHWKIRNRVGIAADRLRRVSLTAHAHMYDNDHAYLNYHLGY